ncbi:MAG TPA: Cof-type HAD-IIB family hydrolase [Bacillota bacterium]|nr:Cof-type HAD-IIB family hydrolase [Bacillota bacterium]
MIRCIALDLDDTLLRSDLTIDAADQQAIRRAVATGVTVLLASGRMVQSMRPYVEQLGLDVPLIAYNGAIIQEAISGKILYHLPVPSQEALRLLPVFRRRGVHLNAYVNDQLYMDELTVWGQKYAANAGVIPHPVGDLGPVLAEGQPHKLLGVGELEQVDALRKELEVEFNGVLQFVKSKPNYLEILAPGVSKGQALAELTRSWGFKPEEVMAVGDAPNDLSMICWAGVGVAIGNARDEVKQAADLVVADHDHQGVAEAIERVVFGRE